MLTKRIVASTISFAFLLLPTAVALAQASHVVEARDNVFDPAQITVAVGDSIEFRNTGKLPHTATAEDKSFDTGNLNAGQSRRVTFTKAGAIKYVCIYHQSLGMTGEIVVGAASGAPSPAAGPVPVQSPAPVATESPGRAEYTPLIFGLVGLLAAAGLAVSGLMGVRKQP